MPQQGRFSGSLQQRASIDAIKKLLLLFIWDYERLINCDLQERYLNMLFNKKHLVFHVHSSLQQLFFRLRFPITFRFNYTFINVVKFSNNLPYPSRWKKDLERLFWACFLTTITSAMLKTELSQTLITRCRFIEPIFRMVSTQSFQIML